MTFELRPSGQAGDDVQRLGCERLDDALRRLERLDGADADVEEHVHEIRKRCKEARGLARLVRPALGEEFDAFDRRVRGAAAQLSSVRDAHVVLATLDWLHAIDPTACALTRDAQAEVAAEATAALRPGDERLAEARRLLTKARRGIKRWDVAPGFDQLGRGLHLTYRRGRRGLRRADAHPSDDTIHELRKAVKQLWYQVRLLEPAAPSALGPLAVSLDDIGDAFGIDHDLAVTVEQLSSDPGRYGGADVVADVARLARAQQADLRRRAVRLTATAYAVPTRSFVARVAAYWELTVDEGPEPEPVTPPS